MHPERARTRYVTPAEADAIATAIAASPKEITAIAARFGRDPETVRNIANIRGLREPTQGYIGAAAMEAELTELSRRQKLTEAESKRLEWAIKRQSEQKRQNRAYAQKAKPRPGRDACTSPDMRA